METVMHCNLRTPDIAPVLLCIKYEVHNVPAYKFNNFTTFADREVDSLNI